MEKSEVEGMLRDLRNELLNKMERIESHLALSIRNVDDRVNQEESDRQHEDSRLEDRIARLEA